MQDPFFDNPELQADIERDEIPPYHPALRILIWFVVAVAPWLAIIAFLNWVGIV